MTENETNGASVLGDIDLHAIMREVRENNRKLDGCTQHRFDGGGVDRMGTKHRCNVCGGQMDLPAIGTYIRGFEAAGGKADDVWPGWRKVTPCAG